MADENITGADRLPDDAYPLEQNEQDVTPPQQSAEVHRLGKNTPSPHGDDAKVGKDSPVYTYFRLYKWHPFTELFCLLAEWFTVAKTEIEQREKFAERHKILFRISVFLDYLLMGLIIIGILGAIIFVMMRTVGIEIATDHLTI